jgi:hypothetical protein
MYPFFSGMATGCLYPKNGSYKLLHNTGNYLLTWHHIPEDLNFQQQYSESLQSGITNNTVAMHKEIFRKLFT